VVQIDAAVTIKVAGVDVSEDDYVIADTCGTVFVPQTHIEKVIDLGERIARRQDGMVEAVRSGRSVAEVMHDTQFEAIRVEHA
jgi:regulator of RNase E activity RraA